MLSVIITGCSVLHNDTAKYSFADGYYRSRLNHNKPVKYYVVTAGDSIKAYALTANKTVADTNKYITFSFPQTPMPIHFGDYYFTNKTFDIDVLTTLFKYRPPVHDFPNQLHTNLSGEVYAGYRTDIYRLSYSATPLHISNRKITHFAYSVGGFMGLGSAHIDEYVTLNRIDYEYDGVVLTGGGALILGLNKLNFGITSGFDYLTDKNRHLWVNELKPWIGLSIGLDLN